MHKPCRLLKVTLSSRIAASCTGKYKLPCLLSRDSLMNYFHLPTLQHDQCQWHVGCTRDSSALTVQLNSQLMKQSSYFLVTLFSL